MMSFSYKNIPLIVSPYLVLASSQGALAIQPAHISYSNATPLTKVALVEEAEEQNPQTTDPALVISLVALLFSFGTTAVSAYNSFREDQRSNRREARGLLQRISKLPVENFELLNRFKGNPEGEQLSSTINQENILLATQAVELIKRYPRTFTSPEYFSVAIALTGGSGLSHDAPFLFQNAIKYSRNYNDYNTATRAFGTFYFTQLEIEKGRDLYRKALSVWEHFPVKNQFIVHTTNLVTLIYWCQVEANAGFPEEAKKHHQEAEIELAALPPGHYTDPLRRQLEAATTMMNAAAVGVATGEKDTQISPDK